MKYCMLKPITHGSEGLTFDIIFSVNMGVGPAVELEAYVSSEPTIVRYMMKYCGIRFMTYCMTSKISGISETTVKWEMRKMEQITAVKPP